MLKAHWMDPGKPHFYRFSQEEIYYLEGVGPVTVTRLFWTYAAEMKFLREFSQ